jgi:hypothetical protein
MGTRPHLTVTIKALENQYLISTLPIFVVPAVYLIRPYGQGLACLVEELVRTRDKVCVENGGGVGYSKGVAEDGLYRTPCLMKYELEKLRCSQRLKRLTLTITTRLWSKASVSSRRWRRMML